MEDKVYTILYILYVIIIKRAFCKSIKAKPKDLWEALSIQINVKISLESTTLANLYGCFVAICNVQIRDQIGLFLSL